MIKGDEINNSKITTVICAVITSNLLLAKVPPNILLEKAHSHLQRSSVINSSLKIIFDID